MILGFCSPQPGEAWEHQLTRGDGQPLIDLSLFWQRSPGTTSTSSRNRPWDAAQELRLMVQIREYRARLLMIIRNASKITVLTCRKRAVQRRADAHDRRDPTVAQDPD
jgi:hypothetical protein